MRLRSASERYSRGDCGGFFQLGVFGNARLPQRGGQALGAHRLEQIVERVQLERVHGVAVVRGDEDDARRLLQAGEMARHLEAAHARHLDVEQEHLRAARRQQLDRLHAVARLAHHLRRQLRSDVFEQGLQALARRLLVVSDEYLELAHTGRTL